MESTTAALPSMPTVTAADQSAAVAENRAQIDRITYLASLASRFEDVDPMMDVLRGVTATWDRSRPLSPDKVLQLHDLERDLKTYLIAKDPVRAFTPESLEQQLGGRTTAGAHPSGFFDLLRVLGPSLLAAAIPFVLPTALISNEARVLIAIPLFFVVLHIGISWLYLSALKNFQQEVRKAFQVICVGIILFGITFSHYAAISAFHLESHPLFEGAGFTWLVSMPFIFIFFGLRIYARQVQVTSKLLSLKVVLAITVIVMIIEAFMPHLVYHADNSDLTTAFLSIGGRMLDLFSALGAILAWKIRSVVAPAYARPITWLFVYLVFSLIASLLTGVLFTLGALEGEGNSNMPFYLVMALAGTPVQLLLMWTGYVFKRELSK